MIVVDSVVAAGRSAGGLDRILEAEYYLLNGMVHELCIAKVKGLLCSNIPSLTNQRN
jgi:hypothetical protein